MPSPNNHDSTVSSFLSRARYRTADRCKSDIMNVLTHYPGLKPKLDKFTFNDGRIRDLVCLSGTIPVPYRGSMYNIPVAMWILDTHPVHAPMCFVVPTPDMDIRVSSHVDAAGKIYLPYLHDWDQNNSDILGLVQMCIITFGEQPPVFAKPPHSQQPTYQPAPYGMSGAAYPPAPFQGYASNQPNMAYPPTPAAGGYRTSVYPPPAAYPPAPNPTSTASNPGQTITQEHVLMSMRSAVEDMVRKRLREEYSFKNGEKQSLANMCDDLKASQNSVRSAIAQVDKECLSLDEAIKAMKSEAESMEAALLRAEDLQKNDSAPEEAVMTTTPLYRQLLNAYAEEAAVHEAIYYLGEALKQEVIDCEVFLKQVRKMARKQFFLKATMNKCRQTAGLPV